MFHAVNIESPGSAAVMTPAAWKSLLAHLPAQVRADLAWWPMGLRNDVLKPLSRATPQTLATVESSLAAILLADCARLFPSLQRAFGGDLRSLNSAVETELSKRVASLQERAERRLGVAAWRDLEWAMRVYGELVRVLSAHMPPDVLQTASISDELEAVTSDPLGRAVIALPLMVLGATSALDDDDVQFDDELASVMCARAYDHAAALQDGLGAQGILIDPFARATPTERAERLQATLTTLAVGFDDDLRQAVADARVSLRPGTH